ncbi:MAG: tetratricopeptide repeat protein [Candidatus Heimdallarchaeota archaeon]|nr:tetratricopeptide repeat protein [Candidatus Heimdallarchaeota archaeon]
MSFEATDIVPIEYQSLFSIISPIEKSGILKIIKEKYIDLKDKYEALFLGLKDYLVNYKNEDISSLVFIMYGQICIDLTKNAEIQAMLRIYPNSPELQFYNIQLQVDKGIFDNIDIMLKNARLNEEQRNMIFNRLVAADKLATIILDLQSFTLEIMFYGRQEEYDKIDELQLKLEDICNRAVVWSQTKDVIFVLELCARMILQRTQLLMNSKGTSVGLEYYEQEKNQEIFNQCRSNVMKANILHVAAKLYYSTGQPTKGLKHMEKAVSILKKVHGRNSWKSTFYHNLAYMYTVLDTKKCTEAYETCLELLEGTEDLHSIASTISNLIGIYTQENNKIEARKYLKRLVEILGTSNELITPFRAYAVASNAMSLDDYELAEKYLKILDEKVEQSPTLMNKAIAASAKFGYYLDAEINSAEAYRWGEESLYYFNKQQDYLNALASVYNLVNTDIQFYKMTEKERFLNSAKKRFNELLTLVGALKQPQWLADKSIALAGFEILSKNLDQAKKHIEEIPESNEEAIKSYKEIIQQLWTFSKSYETNEIAEQDTEKPAKPKFSENPLLNELATNKDATKVMVMYLIEKRLDELVKLPSGVDPIRADIKLILLINNAGLTIYTKIFDAQKMNQQLISNFISAIDSFGKQLFGTKEPYFSINRGNNIILYQTVTDDLNLALIVSQENYDSVMKLTTLSKELSEFLIGKTLDYSKSLNESSEFYKWMEEKINELIH